MTVSTPTTYRRVLPDRRRRKTPMFSRYWLRGRRRGGRRAGESVGIYVDVYRPGELALIVGLVVLSILDLQLTRQHLAAGGSEANPAMAWVLEEGAILGFAVTKTVLTLIAALVLLLHVRFPLARRASQALLVVYCCLMVWHAVVYLDRTL